MRSSAPTRTSLCAAAATSGSAGGTAALMNLGQPYSNSSSKPASSPRAMRAMRSPYFSRSALATASSSCCAAAGQSDAHTASSAYI